MHGLFNRSLQRFLAATYGGDSWSAIARAADVDPPEFEALLIYDDATTRRVLAAAAERLGKPQEDILEDLGTWLVTNPGTDAVRRLLRFGGVDFTSFLMSLDDLPDRARLALADLDLPVMRLQAQGDATYRLECLATQPQFCHVTLGALRAMADDYGALASLDLEMRPGKGGTITIRVYDTGHAEGRSFALGVRAS